MLKFLLMKSNRFGQAEVLDSYQLDQLIDSLPDKTHKPLANVLRRTGCRISEGRQLTWGCISKSSVLFPATIVKGKLKTREIPLHPELKKILDSWMLEWTETYGRIPNSKDFVFPGRFAGSPITTQAFDLALRAALKNAGIEGVSTHSFRRSALSSASSAGIPLRDLQELSGHANRGTLQRYLQVTDKAKKKAAMAFA